MSSGRDAGAVEGELSAAGGGRLGEVLPLAHRRVRCRFAGSQHPDRKLRQITGPFLGGEDDCAATITADAAVQLRQRIGHHPRALHVVDGDRVLVVRLGVQRRVVPRRHRDLGELLDRRAELVHVALRRHRVLRDERVPERHVELDGPARAERQVRAPPPRFEVGPCGRPVHEHDRLDVPGEDRRGGVLDHELPRRPADARTVGPRRTQPEVLGDLDRREQAHAARTEAVDVVLGETGVGDRARRGLVVQLEGRLRVDATDVGERRADQRDSFRAWHSYLNFQSTRLPDANSCCPSAMDSWLVPIATYA